MGRGDTAAGLVRTAFVILSVAFSYTFESGLAGFLAGFQPGASSFTINLEAAAIIVVPTLLASFVIIRMLRNIGAEGAS